MDEQMVIQRLRSRFGRYIRSRSRFRTPLRETLEALAGVSEQMFVFGGLLRDLATRPGPVAPRDVDVVVSGADIDRLEEHFGPSVKRRTRFGGLVLSVNGWRVDVWELHSTWAFRKRVVATPSFAALPRTTFLNVEAVAMEYSPSSGKARSCFEHGFSEAVSKGQVEVNLAENPFPELAVVRSLLVASALGFAVGPRLRRFILAHGDPDDLDRLIDIQWEHYGVVRRHRSLLRTWLRFLANVKGDSEEAVLLPPTEGMQLGFWNTLNWDLLHAEFSDE